MGRYIAIIGADGVGVSHSGSLICIFLAAGHGPRLRRPPSASPSPAPASRQADDQKQAAGADRNDV
jgi:hypothetical protein